VRLAETADRLVLELENRLDLDVRKIERRGDLSDALPHGLLERAAPSASLDVAGSLRRMRRQPCFVIGNGSLDPRGLDVRVFVLAGRQRRPFPYDGVRVRRRREELSHERAAPFRYRIERPSSLFLVKLLAFVRYHSSILVRGYGGSAQLACPEDLRRPPTDSPQPDRGQPWAVHVPAHTGMAAVPAALEHGRDKCANHRRRG